MRTTETLNKKGFYHTYPKWRKDIKNGEFERVWETFRDIFWKAICEGYAVSTPIGKFELVRFAQTNKFENLAIDWGYYNETKEIIRLLNTHTDGYLMKFKYTCTRSRGGRKYKMYTCKHLRRHIAKYIKTNPKKYKVYREINKSERSYL